MENFWVNGENYMANEELFKPIEAKNAVLLSKHVKKRPTIIKGPAVKLEEPVKVVSPETSSLKQGEGYFQPIIEGGQIVGVIHVCTCGRRSELRFEFEDS